MMRPLEWVAFAILSAALVALRIWFPISWTEIFGFATGGLCVWLTVRQNVWTWPLGLANNAIFFVLFLEGRLFADMCLQVLYFALGVYGWWNWLHGGANRGTLPVSRTTGAEWIGIAVTLPIATFAMHRVLVDVNGAVPLADATTTALSLVANYLVTRKRIENWAFWIAADLIYIPMYVVRDLPLTAALYVIFLGMCAAGVRQWLASLRNNMAA